jgi:hypothetical protein
MVPLRMTSSCCLQSMLASAREKVGPASCHSGVTIGTENNRVDYRTFSQAGLRSFLSIAAKAHRLTMNCLSQYVILRTNWLSLLWP